MRTPEKTSTANFLETVVYSEHELSLLDKSRVPYHIAIIPDGNRRWAKEMIAQTEIGYEEGADTLTSIVKAAQQVGIKILTVYCFSTENWGRPSSEVQFLMRLFEKYLKEYQKQLVLGNIRLETIGDIQGCPTSLVKTIKETSCMTQNCAGLTLVLAMNYGSRNEIFRAIKKMLEDIRLNELNPNQISEELISQYLDTAQYPDPDLLIRTSGEQRVSNFLLWQSSYSEIYIDHVYWPSFTPKHFLCALLDYQKRDRRKGGP